MIWPYQGCCLDELIGYSRVRAVAVVVVAQGSPHSELCRRAQRAGYKVVSGPRYAASTKNAPEKVLGVTSVHWRPIRGNA